MTNERALEIIAAYGAEAARWPMAEHDAVMALAGSDAAVVAALAEARRFDVLLHGWARDVLVRNFDAAAIIAAAPVVPARRGWAGARWMAGGALAAALLGIAVIGPGLRTTPLPTVAKAPAMVAVARSVAAPVASPMVLAAAMHAPKHSDTDLAGDAAARLAVADSGALGSDADVFAHVFTPTVYEDNLI